jgi:hypothetical protein
MELDVLGVFACAVRMRGAWFLFLEFQRLCGENFVCKRNALVCKSFIPHSILH